MIRKKRIVFEASFPLQDVSLEGGSDSRYKELTLEAGRKGGLASRGEGEGELDE